MDYGVLPGPPLAELARTAVARARTVAITCDGQPRAAPARARLRAKTLLNGRRLLAAKNSEFAECALVGLNSLLYLGEGRSYLVILLLRERCGQVSGQPVEMLTDDPADLLAARGPIPVVRWRPG